jgi:nucleoside 2-deoxyribosyltransferase
MEVRDVANFLEDAGHSITCPWWKSKAPTVEEAQKDIQGIEDCDVVIGLFDKPYIYKGAILELGMAYAWNKHILIIGNELDSMIFMLLPRFIKVKNLKQALKVMKDKIKQDEPV